MEKQKEKEKELERANMKKKNKIMVVGQGYHEPSHIRTVFHRVPTGENTVRLEIQT